MKHLGTTLKEIQEAAPKAYAQRIRRAETLSAFQDKAFAERVASVMQPGFVIRGILTDICLYCWAVSAVDAGYSVYVAADACGTSSTLGDQVTYKRLEDLGIVVTTTYGVLFELYSDLRTPEGQRAQALRQLPSSDCVNQTSPKDEASHWKILALVTFSFWKCFAVRDRASICHSPADRNLVIALLKKLGSTAEGKLGRKP